MRVLTMFPYLYSYTEPDCWLSYFSCFFLTFTICVGTVLRRLGRGGGWRRRTKNSANKNRVLASGKIHPHVRKVTRAYHLEVEGRGEEKK